MAQLKKYCFVILSIFLFFPNRADTQLQIAPADTSQHIGETQTVCGKVVESIYAISNEKHPTLLYLDQHYPNYVFAVLIWGEDRENFSGSPKMMYRDKDICVTGKIELSFKNKTHIVVKEPSQIQIQEQNL